MPELPEVETVRRELEPWLAGRVVVRAGLADAPPGPKYVHLERAGGQRIESVDRRGKFLVMPLSRGDELIVHLGMTGVLTPDPPADYLRVVVDLKPDGGGRDRLYFRDIRRFGRFLVAPNGDRSLLPTLARMGPEPLEPGFTAEALASGLRTKGPIKARLLGQRAVAGVGNIYADEALWRAGIHPMTPGAKVPKKRTAALRDAIVDILGAAVAARGTTLRDYRTVGGETGGYATTLDVYGREGEPCPRCGETIERIVVGQRGTCFCPRCQPPSGRRARRKPSSPGTSS